jgi:LacI family transcriptional regulator
MKRVTVYDVAKELGVSTSTVSRGLNNSILVGEEMRRRILAAARRLGYRMRPIKRQKRRTILNIALFLPGGPGMYTGLFYNTADLVAGLYDGFGETRANIIVKLAAGDDPFRTKKLGPIDGCVFAFFEPDDGVYRDLEARGVPAVQLNRIDGRRNYVSCDNAGGMEVLFRRLLAADGGHRPCYLGLSRIPAVDARRREGFLAAAGKLGVPAGEKAVFTLSGLDGITDDLPSRLLRRGYTAAMCFNDVVAVAFYQAALRAGVRVPGDLSLTGFDDSPVRELSGRRIDTVSLSVRRLGEEAAAWLRGRIIDREQQGIRRLIAGEYVPGETIGPHRGAAAGGLS